MGLERLLIGIAFGEIETVRVLGTRDQLEAERAGSAAVESRPSRSAARMNWSESLGRRQTGQ